ncbi:MAG: ABC transporter ATP-binding protein [Anaerolineae bacterium]|nr:ABC transporter ATP-binding protein [Anaerolineae bacterium]
MSPKISVPSLPMAALDQDELNSGSATHMNEDDVIIVQNISKMYPLYADPRDRLKQSLWFMLPKFLRNKPQQFYREFWALHDVSFTLKKGQTVGIVGRNGSGKSTLLQIIAGTLAPTVGVVQIRGRVTALLELGSGFNSEFTGRENVYLNGSILGFSREEIDTCFDDIVAFADIGEFLDQPVKLYSSGMTVRLAFAVQAMVPKQLLIVDEALAVGDFAFQRKCMRLMQEFQQDGGSVLLVSHDTQMINRWCQQAILLEGGKVLVKDHSKRVTDIYEQLLLTSSPAKRQQLIEDLNQRSAVNSPHNGHSKGEENLTLPSPSSQYDPQLSQPVERSYGDGRAEIIQPRLVNEKDQPVNVVVCGQTYYWRYSVNFKEDVDSIHLGLTIKRIDGVIVYTTSTLAEKTNLPPINAGTILEVTFSLDLNLTPNTYYFNCGVTTFEQGELTYLHRRVDVAAIRVVPSDERSIDGIAYLNHRFTYTLQEDKK